MRVSSKAEDSGQEGENRGEAEANAVHQYFHRLRRTHKVSQNTSWALTSEDMLIEFYDLVSTVIVLYSDFPQHKPPQT